MSIIGVVIAPLDDCQVAVLVNGIPTKVLALITLALLILPLGSDKSPTLLKLQVWLLEVRLIVLAELMIAFMPLGDKFNEP